MRHIQRKMTTNPYKVVLVRHGQSVYNKENLFSGWHDSDLSTKGVIEAIAAGQLLKQKGYEFDIAFTSLLKRAIKTLHLIQEELDCHWLPVVKSWRLNERHYGSLQGLNKSETISKFGPECVHHWRRSYDVRPPALDKNDPRWSGRSRQYRHLDQGIIPASESLKDTVQRTLPIWHDLIAPEIKSGKRVLVTGHANTFRALIKHLDNVADTDIADLNLPNSVPLVLELDENLRPEKYYFLGTLDDGESEQGEKAKSNRSMGSDKFS
ncbi:unnamed protein product [Lymnaea stagnalis]|uniref:Phosphoglycerate mutase n=1 Tax=Lymnaea stagnalis TaxID=6523 RepID=A0AAV2H571_LYMST